MLTAFSRAELLLGQEALQKLSRARAAVFGVGGVGGYAVEALARGGVGALDLIDDDTVNLTNLNRQIIALHSTLGQYKVDVAKARVLDINPDAQVRTYKLFLTAETADSFDFSAYDYIIDAIDTVSAKIELAVRAEAAGTPIISCMGAGNKLDPTAFRVADIYKTAMCPLSKVMRRELRRRGVRSLKVVYSEEPPCVPSAAPTEEAAAHPKRQTPGSVSFVPSAAGLILAGEVIKDLTIRA